MSDGPDLIFPLWTKIYTAKEAKMGHFVGSFLAIVKKAHELSTQLDYRACDSPKE